MLKDWSIERKKRKRNGEGKGRGSKRIVKVRGIEGDLKEGKS